MLSFLEKPRPEEIDTNLINAGMYVLEPDVLDLIPAGPSRLDRAGGVPAARRGGAVYGVALPGYWLDIGTPDAYLQAHRDVLERKFVTELGDALGTDYTLVEPTRRSARARGSSRRCSSARARCSGPARASAASP